MTAATNILSFWRWAAYYEADLDIAAFKITDSYGILGEDLCLVSVPDGVRQLTSLSNRKPEHNTSLVSHRRSSRTA